MVALEVSWDGALDQGDLPLFRLPPHSTNHTFPFPGLAGFVVLLLRLQQSLQPPGYKLLHVSIQLNPSKIFFLMCDFYDLADLKYCNGLLLVVYLFRISVSFLFTITMICAEVVLCFIVGC